MSVDSLAQKAVDSSDKVLRNQVDAIRAAFPGAPQAALTDAQWNQIKPLYVGLAKTLIENAEAAILKGIINQVDAIVLNHVAGLQTVLTTMVAQITACMASTVNVTPPVPGWTGLTITTPTKNAQFAAVKTELG